MTIALVTHTQLAGPSGGGTTSAINTTGASLLVLTVSEYAAGPLSLPTDSKGNTWTGLTTRTAGSTYGRIFYAVNPTVGTGHTFTLSGANSFCVVDVLAFSGVDTSSPFDVQNGASSLSGAATQAPGSVTPSANNSVVITGIAAESPGTTATVDLSFTITDQSGQVNGVNFAGAAAYLIQTTAGAVNPTWTYSSGTVSTAATIAVFKAASGGTTYNQTCLATNTPPAFLTRQTAKTLLVTNTPPGALARSTGKPSTRTNTTAPTLVRSITKTGLASNVGVALLTSGQAFLRTLTGTNTPAAGSSRSTGKPIAATNTAAATLVRATAKIATVGNSASAGLRRAFARIISGTNTAASALIRSTTKTAGASNTPGRLVTSTQAKVLVATNACAASVRRSVGRILNALNAAVALMTKTGTGRRGAIPRAATGHAIPRAPVTPATPRPL